MDIFLKHFELPINILDYILVKVNLRDIMHAMQPDEFILFARLKYPYIYQLSLHNELQFCSLLLYIFLQIMNQLNLNIISVNLRQFHNFYN
jgi:hypothetical protein